MERSLGVFKKGVPTTTTTVRQKKAPTALINGDRRKTDFLSPSARQSLTL